MIGKDHTAHIRIIGQKPLGFKSGTLGKTGIARTTLQVDNDASPGIYLFKYKGNGKRTHSWNLPTYNNIAGRVIGRKLKDQLRTIQLAAGKGQKPKLKLYFKGHVWVGSTSTIIKKPTEHKYPLPFPKVAFDSNK